MTKRSIFSLLTFSVFILISGCSLFKSRDRNNNTNELPAITTTGSSDCNYGINIFNKNATGNVIRDLMKINGYLKYIPEELKQLYPAARSVWNSALTNVQYNYDSDYVVSGLENLSRIKFDDWKSSDLKDYQKFFLYLTEYSIGKYPEGSHDVLKKNGWIEKADGKKRLEGVIRAALFGNCRNVDRNKIKALIKPLELPEQIEDCLKMETELM